MRSDFTWASDQLAVDVDFGFLNQSRKSPRQLHPQVVLNSNGSSVLRAIRTELTRNEEFTFSVAFVSPRAIALLKQELIDFDGSGTIITSDYLAFNSPAAFAELHALRERLGIDVRVHKSAAFHPKGYIFRHPHAVTAMVGSSNLTEAALVNNHEWNLKVSAAASSDLAQQISELIDRELSDSDPLTQEWIDEYAARYVPPAARPRRPAEVESAAEAAAATRLIEPNGMQREALLALAQLRRAGKQRAIIISATGTGKTILSALDVRAANPRRALFVVHREQIVDRAIEEYKRVLGGTALDYGKMTGSIKQPERRYVFATVQTLSSWDVLHQLHPEAFDYVIFDEAHRTGALTHQRLLDHFRPQFMLGMTATPERTDGINVFEYFNYNVAYEIRLNRALEEDMLAPFHYYGVADVTTESGEVLSGDSDLKVLIAPERVDHVVDAMELYGQAGVAPRGLIFCSRKEEARALSTALNSRMLRGRALRTVALTGEAPMADREAAVTRLEQGELDYILTVDIFNEGVDIPTVNQVIMLRQTQSAIVFVQQLGRGLRKAPGKEYLVVIDFIGNYANNFMIPIALFGDESLNKESLRKNLIAAEENGVLPGLSSVRFDKVAQERVLASIARTRLDSAAAIKLALRSMSNRLGRAPRLWDFHRFESVDPVILATSADHFPDVLRKHLGIGHQLNAVQSRLLRLLTHEVLTAKRLHEYELMSLLLSSDSVTQSSLRDTFRIAGIEDSEVVAQAAVDTLAIAGYTQQDRAKFTEPVVVRRPDGALALSDAFRQSLESSAEFAEAVADVLETGLALTRSRYALDRPFTPGSQYSRRDAARLLGWPRNLASTIYGYKTDTKSGAAAIFVTLHKPDDVSASTAYEDEILDPSTMRWFSKSKRTLMSPDVAPIAENNVAIHVFAQRDGAEGSDHYYLGQASARSAEQASMVGNNGEDLPVVRMTLHFHEPLETALYDYFHPVIIDS